MVDRVDDVNHVFLHTIWSLLLRSRILSHRKQRKHESSQPRNPAWNDGLCMASMPLRYVVAVRRSREINVREGLVLLFDPE